MIIEVERQESWSRGELLLRTFLSPIYFLPHIVCLLFTSIAASFIGILNAFCILFTGRIPESFFYFIYRYNAWSLRVSMRIFNLCDGYPQIGMLGSEKLLKFSYEHQEQYSRGRALLRLLFGLWMGIPHVFCIYFIGIGVGFIQGISFFVILFTGRMPESFADFLLGFLRWQMRWENYFIYYVSEVYPPFSLQNDPPAETNKSEGNPTT